MYVRVRVFQDTSSMNPPALFYKIKKKKYATVYNYCT